MDNRSVLLLLDTFFFVFHSCFTLFCMFAWIWKKTRKTGLILLSLTSFSWFVLGFFYGLGYCFLTDWHWQVRWALGERDFPRSYIKFFVDEITGLNWDSAFVDVTVAVCFGLAVICSVAFNLKDYLKNKQLNTGPQKKSSTKNYGSKP